MDLAEGTYRTKRFGKAIGPNFNWEESQIEASFQLALLNLSAVVVRWDGHYDSDGGHLRNALAALHEAHDDFLDRVQTKRNTEAYYESKGVRVLG